MGLKPKTGDRDSLLKAILHQLKILRGRIAAAGIGDLLPSHIIIGDSTSTNQTMELSDQIDFQIDGIEEGKDYILTANNFQKGEIVEIDMYLDDGTADITISNSSSDIGNIDPASVTSTKTTFIGDANLAFPVDNNLILTAANIVTGETLYGSLKIKILP